MALSVSISGQTQISQGSRVTLTAAVTDSRGNPSDLNLSYAWTASRGSFVGATDQASVEYHADFTSARDVSVDIQCVVTGRGGASAASLTAMTELGITGQLVNMFLTSLGPIASNQNNALYQDGSIGALARGSDQVLSSDITIWRIRWNNSANRIVLNNNQSGSLATYFTTNTGESLYIVFEDGTYAELPQSALVSTGTTWAQWSVTDASVVAKLNALTTTSDLLVGIADAGSINVPTDTGTGTLRLTAGSSARPPVISRLPAQNIVANTAFAVHVPISNNPTAVRVRGLIHGESYTWDAARGRVTIQGTAPALLLTDKVWTVEAANSYGAARPVEITYSYIHAAPVIDTTVTAPDAIVGLPYNFFIPIANLADMADVTSELVGLSHELLERESDGRRGVQIIGTPPDNNYTVRSGRHQVAAVNTGGMDSHDFPFDIKRAYFYLADRISGNDKIARIQFNGDGEDISSDLSFFINQLVQRIAVDANYIYIHAGGFFRVPRTTGNGQTVTPNSLFSASGYSAIAVDDNYIYISNNDTVRRYGKTNGTLNSSFSLPSAIGTVRCIAIDGDDLLVWESLAGTEEIHWMPKNSTGTATVSKRVFVPDWSPNDMTVLGDHIYLIAQTGPEIENILRIDKNTPNNGTVTEYESYTTPDAIAQNPRGIAVYTE